jgi:lipopolysaccharide/colanic/teichoic acid biosynthesis glycosyltransferase
MLTQKKPSKKIYVYCPDQEIEMINALLSKNKISAIINDYSFEPKSFNGTVICHYKSAFLDDAQCDFLIGATKKGAKVLPLVSYLDEKLGFTEVNLLNSAYFFHQKSFSILSQRKKMVGKLVLDYILVVLLAIVAIPIGLITAIFIKCESPGPLFFKQRRTGLFNKEFDVIKFRSMRSDAEKDGPQWASKNDNRVTRVGQFIRKTRIDELPQLINVLKGDMSIIGPRPEREVFIEDLEKDIPYYRFRHAVRPGITGLAQVKYAYGASVEDAIWKHKYDLHYIKHHNIFTDLKIVLLTVSTVLFGMGR